ncbi:MAG: hypothetical protein AAGA81_19275, partial [Acidobacteriota bacterium]
MPNSDSRPVVSQHAPSVSSSGSGVPLRPGQRAPALQTLLALALVASGCQQKASNERDPLDALKAMPYLEFSLETDPSKRGVTLWDQDRAWAGVNLYVSGKEAVLLAMDGRELHSWTVPEGHDRCEYFELLDDGDMVIVCVSTG